MGLRLLVGRGRLPRSVVWSGGVAGFDGAVGALRISVDGGATWSEGAADVAPFALAAEESAMVATTENGLQVSRDGGYSFTAAPGAPLLQLVDFTSGEGVVGLDPSGGSYRSVDLADWQRLGSVDAGQVQALTAGVDDDVWVATTEGLQRSTDAGATFSTALAW